ncbi:thioredoxin family protein [Chitinophaga agrisoli]|uniref:Thioredoxin family protein n=1 Tax=Chitinophaga agrisoli TaxID=2607653 RepID=A0A5B2W0Q0_9BACT|nr:thioredoxin family protein [Chitinophaga agrisoli]KAA2244664.1 thioredoxin family protein [Chitinophaga agrisoli]
MRLKTLLLGGTLLFFAALSSQAQTAHVLKGKLDLKALTSDTAYAWFYTGVNKYQPNDNMLNYIKSNRDKFNIVAIIGTWDAQSRELFPRLYKVMVLAGSPETQMLIFGADEKLDSGAPQDYKIKKVPTFIVMKEGKEIGRITHSVDESVEADLAKILLKSDKKDKGDN